MRLLIFGLAVAACVQAAYKLPKEVTKCRLGDNECLLRETRKMVELFFTGKLKELGLRSFQPLQVDTVDVAQSGINLVLKDMKIYGISDMIVKDIGLDVKKRSFHITYFVPQSRLIAMYTIDANYQVFRLKGSGDFFFTHDNVTAMFKSEIDLTRKEDGLDYLVAKNSQFGFKEDKATIRFTNLFGNEKTLDDAFHQFLDENSAAVSDDIRSINEEFLLKVLTETVQKVFDKLPYNEMFDFA